MTGKTRRTGKAPAEVEKPVGVCREPGCGEPGRHLGWCAAHWAVHRNDERARSQVF